MKKEETFSISLSPLFLSLSLSSFFFSLSDGLESSKSRSEGQEHREARPRLLSLKSRGPFSPTWLARSHIFSPFFSLSLLT